jgi:flagellar biosynthesis protein
LEKDRLYGIMTMEEQKKAIALKYEPGKDPAPVVTARGTDALADEILSLAGLHGVPVERDPALLALLMEVPLWEPVPPELYATVAVVFAQLVRLDRLYAGRGPS